ncbi:glycosyltransferase, partial [Genlisea aurea]
AREFKVLFFPWLAHGHVSPFFELAKRLSKKNFKTYICSTRVNMESIQATPDSAVDFVELHMPPSPEFPPELQTTRNANGYLVQALMKKLHLCKSIFFEILTSIKPDLLIYDFLQLWSAKQALSMDIPSVYFAPSSTAYHSYYHHLYTNGSTEKYPLEAIYLHDHERFDLKHFKNLIEDIGDGFTFDDFNLSTKIMLVKSYGQVEAKYVSHLSNLSKTKIVLTGPLIAESANLNGAEKSNEIMNWLNDQQKLSIVYISFGSEHVLSKEQIYEISKGLELSRVRFLWVIRFAVGKKETFLEEILPEGFLDRTKDDGIIVTEWAPQKKILAHPSIRAFISHCGWSSVTEGLYFGVPIIAMPIHVDQPINARLLVDVGAGIEVDRKPNEIFMGIAIAKTITKVICNEFVYQKMKKRTVHWSNEIRENEEEELNGVAEELRKIC